ncbi:MAG: translation initiation factor IF-3 [Synergistaceae bacterium]
MHLTQYFFGKTFRRCSAIVVNIKEDEPRVNYDIKAVEILLIDEENEKRGVVNTKEAIAMAEAVSLDLVEVAPQATPPVCRIMDYGKYRFQQQKRDKDARKKQKNQAVKEIKMRPKIDQHDYDFKTKAVKTFLQAGHRVKVSIFFRGREMAFLDRGREVLERVIKEVEQFGKVESEPRMEGSYMRIMIAPGVMESVKKKPVESTPKKISEPTENTATAAEQTNETEA